MEFDFGARVPHFFLQPSLIFFFRKDFHSAEGAGGEGGGVPPRRKHRLATAQSKFRCVEADNHLEKAFQNDSPTQIKVFAFLISCAACPMQSQVS